MSEPTELYLPPNLPYPLKIVANAAPPSSTVNRGSRLLSYSFTHISPNQPPEIRFGTWDSSIEGTVEKWNFNPGDVVSQRRAKEVPAVLINEPCKHSMQLGGLCCLCGKDMTISDYNGFSDAQRASIQMTHLANGPTVSLEEAQRIERETAEHLLKSRKLSLIVDLDQTIVHATVDPTVGEWIQEGEAWEARRAKRAAEKKSKTGDDEGESDGTASDSDDEVNPNWEALKDVKKFRLGPEALGQADVRGPRRGAKSVEQDGCMYYIKPRPGWQEFLKAMAAKYEMHVYTMGTRAYAEEVCAAIDPDGKFFGGRILSRDESGSLTQKSLQRLFPCDQSMVVIIDDRADVWEWSPNLVKVIPYDFFVGIGDINSAFLPKLEPMTPPLPPGVPAVTPTTPTPEPTEASSAPPSSSEKAIVVPNGPIEVDESEAARKSEILTRNHMALDAQVEERPLAKKQEELQEASQVDSTITDKAEASSSAEGEKSTSNGNGEASTSARPKEKVVRKALLRNDDIELVRVRNLLDEVHRRFYNAFDAKDLDQEQNKSSQKRKRKDPSQVPYDVRAIIPQIRMHTFEGVHILFSSVIPLDVNPESTEIWRTALAFGAKCYRELNPKITHVVAAKRGTQKVDAARRQGGIKIVWLSWFTDSIAFWHRQEEGPYLMDPEPIPSMSGPVSPLSDQQDQHQISSDPEPDADDWDDETRRANKAAAAAAAAGGGVDADLELDEIDWDEINNEVEAAMNESDDDEGSVKTRSGQVTEDEDWTDETNSIISSTNSTPRKKRKRLRSITPTSDAGPSASANSDVLRSPLAKRKKVAADRSGASKLKEAFSAADIAKSMAGEIIEEDEGGEELDGSSSKRGSKATTPRDAASEMDEDDEDDAEDGEDDDGSNLGIDEDDDFLARELGEDWG
ncbi:hypothetical protein K474DRAFT_1666016 [Panus rudis PR-1116 ss-1]|nr:hypothetical protein K474DRAFT_1666016 [Panus rudis PR-1116 ss-1]